MLSLLFGVILFCVGTLGPFIYEPCLGLAVFAVFTHVPPQQLGIVALRAPLIVACATLLSYLLSTKYPRKFTKFPPELLLFSIMLTGMFLGSLNAYNSQLAFEHFSIYCKYWLYLFMLVNILDTLPRVEIFNNCLILSAAWLVYKCWDLRGTTGARFENMGGGVVGDSNHFAAALIMLMPLVLMRAFRNTNKVIRIGALLGVFGMVMAVLITMSRGAFLGLATLVVGFSIYFKSYRTRILAALFCISIVCLPFLPENYVDRIATISGPEEEQRDASSQSRLDSWKVAIDVWKRFPVYGCGLRNFIYYNAYENEGKDWGEQGHVAHSLWFEALGEGGVLVFVPLVSMIGLFFWRTARAKRKYGNDRDVYFDIVAVQVGMIGFLVCASFVNRMIYEPIYWWCGLAYVYDKGIATEA